MIQKTAAFNRHAVSVERDTPMDNGNMTSRIVSSDEKWLYKTGGIAALALGVTFIVTILLYVYVGKLPSGGAAWLQYMDGKRTAWSVILVVSVLTDLLFVPVALALYAALREVHRGVMLIATSFIGLFLVLDLAVNWSNYMSLISLSGSYSAAKSDAQRSAYIGAANYASSILTSRLESLYSIGILSLAILLVSIVMLNGAFGRVTAYVGIAAGILGIISIGGWAATVLLNTVLAAIWILLVARGLYFRYATEPVAVQQADITVAV
jgi:hypothetical protein